MSDSKTKVVQCPEAFAPLFEAAEGIMGAFFQDMRREPERGDIQISGVRYLLMRTDSLAIELHEELRKTFGEAGARQIRYKIARACGMRDAKMFHERLEDRRPDHEARARAGALRACGLGQRGHLPRECSTHR